MTRLIKVYVCGISSTRLAYLIAIFRSQTAAVNEYITHLQSTSAVDSAFNSMYMPKSIDNIDIVRQPIHAGYDRFFNLIIFCSFNFSSFSVLMLENIRIFEKRFQLNFFVCKLCIWLSFIVHHECWIMHDTNNFHHRMNHCIYHKLLTRSCITCITTKTYDEKTRNSLGRIPILVKLTRVRLGMMKVTFSINV